MDIKTLGVDLAKKSFNKMLIYYLICCHWAHTVFRNFIAWIVSLSISLILKWTH